MATATLNDDKSWLGTRYDAGAGLQYLNARYYDPELAMFLQPDWFEVMQPGVGTNRYAYAAGDPINRLDPWGNAWWNDWGDLKDALDSIGNAYDRARENAADTYDDIDSPVAAWGIRNLLPGYADTKEKIGDMKDAYERGDYISLALSGAELALEFAPGAAGAAADVAESFADLIGIGRKAANAADEAADAARGGTYTLRDRQTGDVMRNGRTNDHDRREREHERGADTRDLQYQIESRTDDYATQRGLEQIGLDTMRGPLDKIRGIARGNQNYDKYMDAGRRYLERKRGGR